MSQWITYSRLRITTGLFAKYSIKTSSVTSTLSWATTYIYMYESNEIRYGRKMSRYQHYPYSVSVSPNTFYGTIEIDISYRCGWKPASNTLFVSAPQRGKHAIFNSALRNNCDKIANNIMYYISVNSFTWGKIVGYLIYLLSYQVRIAIPIMRSTCWANNSMSLPRMSALHHISFKFCSSDIIRVQWNYVKKWTWLWWCYVCLLPSS